MHSAVTEGEGGEGRRFSIPPLHSKNINYKIEKRWWQGVYEDIRAGSRVRETGSEEERVKVRESRIYILITSQII